MASSADDVHMGSVAGRIRVYLRGTRRMGLWSQSNARSAGRRYHRTGILPADIRSVPATPGLVKETDFQLDPLACRKRRAHLLQ